MIFIIKNYWKMIKNQIVTWSDVKAQFIESEAKKAFFVKTKKIWLAKKAELINGIKTWNESYDLFSETDKVWLAEVKEFIYTKEEELWLAKKAWIEEVEKAWLEEA